MERGAVDGELRQRLRRLILLRLVMVTTILAAARYVEVVTGSLLSINALYLIVGVTYGVSIIHAALLRFSKSVAAAAVLQILVDLIVVTALVYVEGGTAGGFVLLYPIVVLSATVLLQRRGGVMTSVLATVFYGAMLFAVRIGVVPTHGLSEIRLVTAKALVYSVFLTAVACVTVAMIGAYFTQSLKSVDTRLQQATAEVADLREVNQLIVENIQSGLLTTDRATIIHHVNSYGERVLQRGRADLCGKSLGDLFGNETFSRELVTGMVNQEKVSRLEIFYRRPDGKEMLLGLSISRLATVASAGPIGYLVVFQDLTEIKRLEDQVRAKERLAALGEMAAQLAHEIRNPLGSISGAAQVLMNDDSVSGEEEQLLTIIRRESQRLSDTLNEFLLQTRPSPVVKEIVDIGAVIQQAVTLLRNGLESGGRHSVSLSMSEGPCFCRANADQMTQVFWNLARNGIAAMPNGGELRVALARTPGEIRLSVRDGGLGMRRVDQRALFTPFTSSSQRGTGLGLAIVYRIVRDHSGDIVIRSIPDRGTEVEVRLPAVDDRASSS